MKKAIKILLSSFILALSALSVTANNNVVAKSLAISDTSSDYYKNADASSGEKLINSLTSIISSGTKDLGYNGLLSAYAKTDCKPGTNIIWDMYSNEEFVCGGPKENANYKKEGDGYNREHSIPQSWFNEKTPMKSDLFHVYPTDGYVNNRRSNYPFGEVSSATYTSKNGSKVGSCSFPGYNGTVFEPIDEYKGDFARTYFYMATRYRTQVGSWGSGANVVFKGSYPYLTTFAVDLFTKWSHDDPVSEKEIARNDAVYSLQKNRNPYIDNPEWIDIIWENDYQPVEPNQEKVNACIAKINALPSTITLENEALINEANTLYINLNSAERKLITNYQKLSKALDTISSLKGQSGNTGDDDTQVDISGDKVTFTMPSDNFNYKEGVSITIDNCKFSLSQAGCYDNEFRLGFNKTKTCDSAFTVSEKASSSLKMEFDIENAIGFNINAGINYSTTKFYAYFSSDQGKTWKQIGTASDATALNFSIDSPEKGRFALVIAGPEKPRLAIESIDIFTSSEVGENPELSNVQAGISLGLNYKIKNNTVIECSTQVIISATLTKTLDGAKYYVEYTTKDGANTQRVEFMPINNEVKVYIGNTSSYQYVYNIVCEYEGKTYKAKSITYSISGLCDYYLNNNLVTDSNYKLCLEYILSSK